MKKIIPLIILIIQSSCFNSLDAQVLNVNNNQQQENQWCWAGCSKTILDYYGFSSVQQCDIAEFVRTTATFHDFGAVNCCTNPSQGCNYWNYMYGDSGSIYDILINFGNIQNTGIATSLTLAQITTEIQNNRLFVIRWGWSSGGGHFIVGHGINGNNIYFMNPWYGEGLHIGTYNFVKSGVDATSSDTHTWTHTLKITSNMLTLNESETPKKITLYPNPLSNETTLSTNILLSNATLKVYNSLGEKVKEINNINSQIITITRDNLSDGLYYILLSEDSNVIAKDKLIIADK